MPWIDARNLTKNRETRQDKSLFRSLSGTYLPSPNVSRVSAEGASGFCQTMPPSDRQLMSIGTSEHRAFVRAKARFAGQKAQGHSFIRRNAVFTGHIAMYRWRHFRQSRSSRRHRTASGSSLRPAAARCEPFLVNSLLPGPLTCTPAASVTGATSRCEPFPAFLLLPRPSTYPAGPSAASVAAGCEPIPAFLLLPGPSTCPCMAFCAIHFRRV